MIESRKQQLIYEIVLLVVGALTIFFSFYDYLIGGGWVYLDHTYVVFSNLVNYLIEIFLVVLLVQTIKKYRKKEDGPLTFARHFTFYVLVWMMTYFFLNLIFAYANFVLDGFSIDVVFDDLPIMNTIFTGLVFPVLYLVFWILYYDHGKIRWYDCLLSLIIPIIYIILAYARESVVININEGYPARGGTFTYAVSLFHDIYYFGVWFQVIIDSVTALIMYIIALIFQTADKSLRKRIDKRKLKEGLNLGKETLNG